MPSPSENPYADMFGSQHWLEGFEAGRASRDAEVAEADVLSGRWCATNQAEGRGPCGACKLCLRDELAAAQEKAARCEQVQAAACRRMRAEKAELRAQLAEKEAYIKDLDALLQETHTKAEAAYARGLQASAEDFAEKEAECERLRERLSAVIASADHALGIAPASKGEGDG